MIPEKNHRGTRVVERESVWCVGQNLLLRGTIVNSKWDQILLVKISKYIGFRVYCTSYLIPGMVPRNITSLQIGLVRWKKNRLPYDTITLGWWYNTPPRTIFEAGFLDDGEGVLSTTGDAFMQTFSTKYFQSHHFHRACPGPPCFGENRVWNSFSDAAQIDLRQWQITAALMGTARSVGYRIGTNQYIEISDFRYIGSCFGPPFPGTPVFFMPKYWTIFLFVSVPYRTRFR